MDSFFFFFTKKVNSHAFKVEIHTRQKLCHFGRYDAKTKLFCQQSVVPVTGLECSYGVSSPVTDISVAKTEISVSRARDPFLERP